MDRVKLIRGMGENFTEPCDLIITEPQAQLNTSLRNTPKLIIGFANRSQCYSRWALATLVQLGVWGRKQDRAVWVGNAQPFAVDLAGIEEDAFGRFPAELAQRLLAAYPGKKDVVADPFMGCGTVGKAVYELGSEFVGVDRHKDNVDAAYAYLGCVSL